MLCPATSLSNMHLPDKIRNIAVIAHIDHGKTTLLDAILKQSNIFREEQELETRMMDSYDQEKERGITIFSKYTAVEHSGFKINIIDTPGHADFSGEVERILGMVNAVLLLVDAREGPMPQTRFVLSLALKMKLKPLVVLNKIDRPHADPDAVLDKTFDLFVELNADDEQLDFPYVYASALRGYSVEKLSDEPKNLESLFDLIIKHTPAPKGEVDAPFLMQTNAMLYDNFLGRGACGRVLAGSIKAGEPIVAVSNDGTTKNAIVKKIQGHHGMERVELESATCGDIVLLHGVTNVDIGDTICHPDNVIKLPPIELGEPTVSIDVYVNSSPFVSKDGKHVTMSKIKDRLDRERESNISLSITETPGCDDRVNICGRGELHLSVLLEAMRREGYEFSVSRPQVVMKKKDGELLEPFSTVHIEVPQEFSGAVIEDLSKRRGVMTNLQTTDQNLTLLSFFYSDKRIDWI